MGLCESGLTAITELLSLLSRCEVSCDSLCCQSLCWRSNHCIFNTGTHAHIDSNSDGDADK